MTKQKTLILSLSAIFFLAVSFIVYSWTEPTTMPAIYSIPINTSGSAQTKTGALTVPIIYDTAGCNAEGENCPYYVNPSGLTRLTKTHFEGGSGDVNQDGVVNSLDVDLIYAYLNEDVLLGSPSFTPEMRAEADVNGDGFVNHLDAELISSMIENNYATLSEAQLAGKQIADIDSNYSRDSEVTPTVSFQNAKLIEDLSSLAQSLEGHSSYPVGSLCIEDTSNNSAFLSYLGLTAFPIHPNYKKGGTALTTNDCFLYFSDGENYSIRTPAMGNEGYLIQESRHPETKDIQTSCDPGWIPFGNRCVMKYEAKAMKKSDNSINLNGCNDAACLISTYTAVSVEEGKPWVKISQTNAKAACEAIGAHLITNAEWMAIARDIESVNSNWSDTVLNRGNSNTYASMNGTNPLLGFNKRTHTLSNGEIIWDIAGNVNEWVDETRLPSEIPSYREAWREFNSAEYTSKLPYNEVGPVNSTRTSSNGVGITYIDNNKSVYAFLRGGDWSYDTNAGVFTLTLTDSPSGSNMYVGFRCAR